MAAVLDTAILGALGMMTGVAFVLYTNYMVTDPGTTPSKPASQFAFGAGIAMVYGLLTGASIAYGLFFATAVVCLVRGRFLWALHFVDKAREQARQQQRGRGVERRPTAGDARHRRCQPDERPRARRHAARPRQRPGGRHRAAGSHRARPPGAPSGSCSKLCRATGSA